MNRQIDRYIPSPFPDHMSFLALADRIPLKTPLYLSQGTLISSPIDMYSYISFYELKLPTNKTNDLMWIRT